MDLDVANGDSGVASIEVGARLKSRVRVPSPAAPWTFGRREHHKQLSGVWSELGLPVRQRAGHQPAAGRRALLRMGLVRGDWPVARNARLETDVQRQPRRHQEAEDRDPGSQRRLREAATERSAQAAADQAGHRQHHRVGP